MAEGVGSVSDIYVADRTHWSVPVRRHHRICLDSGGIFQRHARCYPFLRGSAPIIERRKRR